MPRYLEMHNLLGLNFYALYFQKSIYRWLAVSFKVNRFYAVTMLKGEGRVLHFNTGAYLFEY